MPHRCASRLCGRTFTTSLSCGPAGSPLYSSCQPTSSMTVFSQPSSFPHSLDERTPFPFRWCLCFNTPDTTDGDGVPPASHDSPLPVFSSASGKPHLALGGGWCPGWPQATPKGPQGL